MNLQFWEDNSIFQTFRYVLFLGWKSLTGQNRINVIALSKDFTLRMTAILGLITFNWFLSLFLMAYQAS